jgi:hypothetical protein
MFKELCCKLGFHKKKIIEQGYPRYSNNWIIIYRCEWCRIKIRIWDDLFAPPRPDHFPINEDYLVDEQGNLKS